VWVVDSSHKIVRVFPRRTEATPVDSLAYVGDPFFPAMLPEAGRVHVSVTFSWDIAEAERLAAAWAQYYGDVRVDGPALGNARGEFVPGLYLKPSYVVTSRGCPNRCWFCHVPDREGQAMQELAIHQGWIVCDSNLLACSREHVEAVFQMLRAQKTLAA